MARPREFNQDEVIERAMMLFWEKGYEATSIRDLKKAMGISSSSMYEVFGDKRGIFLLALTRFCEVERLEIARKAAEAPTPQAFITQLFASVEAVTQPDSTARASLALNAMVEFGTLDPDVTRLLLAHYFGIAAIVADVLAQGQQQGKISSRTPPLELAYTIVSTLHGVATLKGVKPDFGYVPAIRDTLLTLFST
jgi:TetR/AcrR family transcriptional repressor of nem operon